MIEVRNLTTIEEFDEAVRLQKTIWGFADIELLPRRLFVTAGKVGGQTIGAFDGNRMVAFLLAIPGRKPSGLAYLHSHMLGTVAEYRNQGLGRLLKLKQREDAIARGISLVEWTFDPLELKNAFFNIERLGAIMRRYVFNNYGITASHLHAGLPTDRLVAEWWIEHPVTKGIIDGAGVGRPAVEARIAIPSNIGEIKELDPKQARSIQKAMSEQFAEYFGRDLAVVGFESTKEAGTYLLGKWA